jgi:DNA adenine methylase
MNTILKWPGGKEKELPIIRANIPNYIGRYVEPFVGGGAVFFNQDNPHSYINDKSDELINFYQCIKKIDPDFFFHIKKMNDEFQSLGCFIDENTDAILSLYHLKVCIDVFLSRYTLFFNSIAVDYHEVFIKELHRNLSSKIKRSHELEIGQGFISDSDRISNIESALKSSYYMYIRYLYNKHPEFSDGRKAAIFFFIREYCYSSMFRYNKQGEFNVPYGGISYNRKAFGRKIEYLLSNEMNNKLATTEISNLDFEDFIEELELSVNDFVFLDPPYDSDFPLIHKTVLEKKNKSDYVIVC